MKRILSVIICILSVVSAYAQPYVDKYPISCGMDAPNAKSNYGQRGDTVYRPYIPYNQQGYILVHVNLVFLQKDDGSGGFQKDNAEHQQLWREVEIKLNEMYANLEDSKLETCYLWKDPFLSDTKIRFVFNSLYVKDTYAWNRLNNHEFTYNGLQVPPLTYIDYLQESISRDNNVPFGVNVFFTEDSNLYERYMAYGLDIPDTAFGGANYAASLFPDADLSQIHMPDIYCSYLWMKYIIPYRANVSWENTVRYWFVNNMAGGMAHELGHSLDLAHTCNHYQKNNCPHALMHQSGNLSEHFRNYIPPTEIGKIHKALIETRLMDYVDADLASIGVWPLKDNLTFSFQRIYSDLNILSGAQVCMQNNVYMPPNAKIEVSGLLHLKSPNFISERTNIQCADNDKQLNEIRVKEGGVLRIGRVDIDAYDIVVETGGTIILNGSIDVKNGHKIIIDSGAYICASTGNLVIGEQKPFYANVNELIRGIPSEIAQKYGISCGNGYWDKFVSATNPILDILYIQNENINQAITYVGKTIIVGNSVNPNSSRPKGDVVVNAPARATFVYKNRLVLDKGFRCNSGGSYRGLRF